MNAKPADSGNFQTRTKSNTVNLAIWTFAWVSSMAVSVFGPMWLWESKIVTGVAILINTLFGVGMILANKRHLKGLDELQQKVHLDAMAITLGVGLVGGLSYSTMDTTNLISTDAEISFLVMLMAITYLISIIVGMARYK